MSKYWKIPPDCNTEFVAKMEDVLETYTLPYNSKFPVVCMDESSKQLIGDVATPIPAAPGHPHLMDDEYLVSSIGDDVDGYDLRAELGSKGISYKYISTTPALPTGTAMFEPDDVMSARNIHIPAAWQFSPQLETLAEHADAVCFGLLSQRKEVTASTVRYFLEATKPECLRVLDLNINHNFCIKKVVVDSLLLCNILKLNADELEWLTDLLDLGGNIAVMSILAHRYNLKYIILTRGTDGSVLYDGNSFVAIPALSYGEDADDSGCGDAFTAAFVTAMLYDMRPADAMLHASRVAGYVCSKSGAMPEIPPEHRLVVDRDKSGVGVITI